MKKARRLLSGFIFFVVFTIGIFVLSIEKTHAAAPTISSTPSTISTDSEFILTKKYEEKNDYDSMLKDYLMEIEKGNSSAMNNLGVYYCNCNDYGNMMKYYLMAIEKGSSIAMYNLVVIFKIQVILTI